MDTQSGGGRRRHIWLGMQDNGLAAIDAETQYIAQLIIIIPLFFTLTHARTYRTHTRYLFVCSNVLVVSTCSQYCVILLSHSLCVCVRRISDLYTQKYTHKERKKGENVKLKKTK